MKLMYLDDELADEMAQGPESGMGFQLITATIELDTTHELQVQAYLVLNSRYVLPYKKIDDFMSVRQLGTVRKSGAFPETKVRVQLINKIELIGTRLLENIPTSLFSTPTKLKGKRKLPPSLVPPLALKTTGNEAFFRYSPVLNDRRVQVNGALTSGTYATTYNDARMVPSGFSAVGRYALPNPMPAKYVYTIVPPKGTRYLVGAVRPAYGQAGGGVEVLFQKGSNPATYAPHELPDA